MQNPSRLAERKRSKCKKVYVANDMPNTMAHPLCRTKIILLHGARALARYLGQLSIHILGDLSCEAGSFASSIRNRSRISWQSGATEMPPKESG